MKARIVLADDHALVRAGIRALLEKMPNVVVVAEADNGREAIALVRTTHPDLVLMDIAMTGLNGLEALAHLTKNGSKVKLLVLSAHANEEYVIRALRDGASGYLLKDAATAELELAIHSVLSGKTYLSPSISRNIIDDYLERVGDKQTVLDELTPRQREILQSIAEGKNTKEIASILDISPKTVEAHRLQLMDRLNIHDIAGLVRYAIRTGLVSI